MVLAEGEHPFVPHPAQLLGEGAAVKVEVVSQLLAVEGKVELHAARLNGLAGQIGQQPPPHGLGGGAEDAAGEGEVLFHGDTEQIPQQADNIGGAVNELGDRMDRVGAGAAALAALHPLDFDPDDKWDVAAGYGNYKDAHAVAVGAFYRPNEDTMFSVGGSFGGGENMVNAGVSVKLGQGNHVSTSKVAMAKEIVDLRDENKDLKKRLDTMEQKMNSILGILDMGKKKDFPDVPENHWAYEYVSTLAGNGILEGYPDGMFSGERSMTRYEFAAMFYRALKN